MENIDHQIILHKTEVSRMQLWETSVFEYAIMLSVHNELLRALTNQQVLHWKFACGKVGQCRFQA